MRRPKRVHKEQWSKVSCEAGTARKLKMTKRKKSNSGKKENQMEVQSAGEKRLEEFWEQRRTERSSLQAELMQKAPEFFVHERTSQGGGMKVLKREEESERLVHRRGEGKAKQLFGEE